MTQLFTALIPYRGILFALLVLAFLGILALILLWSAKAYRIKIAQIKAATQENSLFTTDFSEHSILDKNFAARQAVAADGIDTSSNDHLVISDGGRECYVRYFTITALPNQVTFYVTFRELLNFPNCISSIFVNPISTAEASRQLDKHVIVLEGEEIAAGRKGDRNRARKISHQRSETESWAAAIENDEDSFFQVGFLFELTGTSMDDLNTQTDTFVHLGMEKGIILSACYGVQAEAHLSNSPMNERVQFRLGPVRSDACKLFLMDRYSLATIWNYSANEFRHPQGKFLGYNLSDGSVILYDQFAPSHSGYNLVIAGTIGSGKSTSMKAMMLRNALDCRGVAVDVQSPAGTNEGEYCALARALNGRIYSVKAGSSDVINPFEIETSKVLSYTQERPEGIEQETLELKEKSNDVAAIIHMMLTQNNAMAGTQAQADQMATIQDIISSTILSLYEERGIYDGMPDSLYRQTGGSLRIKKEMPTLTDFFVSLARQKKKLEIAGEDAFRQNMLSLMMSIMRDFVSELYYAEDSIQLLSKEEYQNLPKDPDDPQVRAYIPVEGLEPHLCQHVNRIVGIRPYYDGQSTVRIDQKCSFTDIDLSQLPPTEMALAQWIAINFVHTQFIMKNSEDPKKAEKLIAIYDEGHIALGIPYVAERIAYQYRTARKRYVSVWLAMQQLSDLETIDRTAGLAIVQNTDTFFLFKHSPSSKEYLKSQFQNLTESQLASIFELGGSAEDKRSESFKRTRGECCIIDSDSVYFAHIAYIPETEARIAETNPEIRARMARENLRRRGS